MFNTIGLITIFIETDYIGRLSISVANRKGSQYGDLHTDSPNEALEYIDRLERNYYIIDKRNVLRYSKLRTLAELENITQ